MDMNKDDRQWARALLETTLKRLRAEDEMAGNIG